MARQLTSREHAVLAHIVLDPVEWWNHVCSRDGSNGLRAIDCEAALLAKVDRWGPKYDAAIAAPNYKTRAERDAESAQP